MSALDELRERHKSVRGYPMARHPNGQTYTAIVEQFCEQCYAAQPCDVNVALAVIDRAAQNEADYLGFPGWFGASHDEFEARYRALTTGEIA